ncbi:hypothetical protein DSECCO2_455210 [anaerobic digester metagenome]
MVPPVTFTLSSPFSPLLDMVDEGVVVPPPPAVTFTEPSEILTAPVALIPSPFETTVEVPPSMLMYPNAPMVISSDLIPSPLVVVTLIVPP